MRSIVLTAAVLVAVFTGPAMALDKDVYLEKVAASGQPLIIGSASATNPDCSNEGSVILRLLKRPKHGTFSNADAMIFTHFPASNPGSVCNTRRVPGEEQTYTSDAGYTGPDTLEFELIFPEGGDQRVHIAITVK